MRLMVLLIAAMVFCAPAAADEQNQEQWSNRIFRGDYRRTGVVDEEGVPRNPTLKWTFEGEKFLTAPAIYKGVAYTGSGPGFPFSPMRRRPGRVHALRLYDGEPLWSVEVDGLLASTPLPTEESLYFGTMGERFYCLDRATGEVKWMYPDPSTDADDLGMIFTAPVLKDETVYFVTGRADFLAIDAATGELLWEIPLESWRTDTGELGDKWVRGAPVLRGNYIYFVLSGEFLCAVDVEKRELAWRDGNECLATMPPLYLSFPSPCVGSDGRFLFVQKRNSFLRGQPLADDVTHYVGLQTTLFHEKGRVRYKAENWIAPYLAVDRDRLYMGTQHARLYAVDTSRPRHRLWLHKGPPGSSLHSPTVSRDVVYVGMSRPEDEGTQDNKGAMLAIDGETGEKLWAFPLDSPPWQPPVVEDGVVYISSIRGKLYAIEEQQRDESTEP